MLALLPFVLMSLTDQSTFAPWFCLFTGIAIIALSLWVSMTALRETRPWRERRYPWARRILLPIQWVVGLGQFLPLVTTIEPFTMYALALWWLVLVAAIQFIIQIAAASRKSDYETR